MEEGRPTEREQQISPGESAPARDLVDILVGDWRPSKQQVLQWIRIALAVGLVLLVVIVMLDVIGLLFGISLLNLLKVLAVPLTVGAAVPLLNWLQKKRELEVEDQRAQDEALQEYLKQMSGLLTDKDPPLHKVSQEHSLSKVAWAWTKTVLRRMDPKRKGYVLRFVNEAGLINKDRPVFTLSNADLRCAVLRDSVLIGVRSREGALFPGINLSGADLSGADLSGAILTNADLRGAELLAANLQGADLRRVVGLTQAQIENAFGSKGTMLTEGLMAPPLWSRSLADQNRIVQERFAGSE